jgi:hypothetical protein
MLNNLRLFGIVAGCLFGTICFAQGTDKGSSDRQVNDKCPIYSKNPDKYPALKEMIGHIQQFAVQAKQKRPTLPDIDFSHISVQCDLNDKVDQLTDSESERNEIKNAIALIFSINGHKGPVTINVQSPMFISADRAFKSGKAGIDMVIAEGRIYSEFVERYGGNISETKSAEIAYVSDGFEKLSAMLRSNPDQQTRAKDYLAKLKAEEPVTK